MIALDGPFKGKEYRNIPDQVENLVDHYMDYSTGEVYQATYKRLPDGWKFVKINNMFGEVVDITLE